MSIIRLSLRIALALLALPALVPNVAAQPRTTKTARPLTVRFEFETKGGLDGHAPRSRVFVNANGKRTRVFSNDESFQALSRDEFSTHRVPRRALAACFGWWAGAGDNLYVVRRGAQLDVYQQPLDEQSGPFRFCKIKSIRFSSR